MGESPLSYLRVAHTLYYGASTDRTVAELKTDVTELLQTLVRGSAGALALCI